LLKGFGAALKEAQLVHDYQVRVLAFHEEPCAVHVECADVADQAAFRRVIACEAAYLVFPPGAGGAHVHVRVRFASVPCEKPAKNERIARR